MNLRLIPPANPTLRQPVEKHFLHCLSFKQWAIQEGVSWVPVQKHHLNLTKGLMWFVFGMKALCCGFFGLDFIHNEQFLNIPF